MAFTFAKAERLAELRGDYRAKRWDSRGLHPYSVEWGRILAFEVALPELGNERWIDPERPVDPVSLRLRARALAEIEFREAIINERRQSEEDRTSVAGGPGDGEPGDGAAGSPAGSGDRG